jgi:CheY-like chemotaxis protein
MPARILVVKDHRDSRELLAFMLRSMGYEVIEAANGQEAIEKAGAEEPDLVIMDLGLPGINGIEATVKLKQDPKTAHIPVIAHSAWSEEQYRAAALRAGMVEFLTKPTPPKVFGEVLQRLLKSSRERECRKASGN